MQPLRQGNICLKTILRQRRTVRLDLRLPTIQAILRISNEELCGALLMPKPQPSGVERGLRWNVVPCGHELDPVPISPRLDPSDAAPSYEPGQFGPEVEIVNRFSRDLGYPIVKYGMCRSQGVPTRIR